MTVSAVSRLETDIWPHDGLTRVVVAVECFDSQQGCQLHWKSHVVFGAIA